MKQISNSLSSVAPLAIAAAMAVHTVGQAAPIVFSGTGANGAALASTLNGFRTAIGGVNNGANNPVNTIHATGRREINWDAAALPVDMPADFFNRSVDTTGQAGSRRGAVFTTPGTGFQVSRNETGTGLEKFGNVDASYATEFTLNSAQRLFAAKGSTELDTHFFLPNVIAQGAGVNAFGAVFTDVDTETSAKISLYDCFDNLLAEAWASPLDKGLSFVGIQLDAGDLAVRVRIQSGTAALGAGVLDGVAGDVVAMDDFIYSEPKGVPDGGATGVLLLGLLGVLPMIRMGRGLLKPE